MQVRAPGATREARFREASLARGEPAVRVEGRITSRLGAALSLRCLLAFGAEFLALLAVQALGVGFLGAFERSRGVRPPASCPQPLAAGAAARAPARRSARTRSSSAAGKQRRSRPRGKKGSSWEHLGLKRRATSARDAEPWMNEAGRPAFRVHDILQRGTDRSVVTRRRWARMGVCQICHGPKETKDDRSSKIIVCRCGVGFCRVRGDFAGAGADHAGMQCKISGRQDRRHAQRPEMERFPQGPMRRRCCRGARRCAGRRSGRRRRRQAGGRAEDRRCAAAAPRCRRATRCSRPR